MSDLDSWTETGMTNNIVCIWARPGDIVSVVDEYNSDRSGPVSFSTTDDGKRIFHVDCAMIAWEYEKNHWKV